MFKSGFITIIGRPNAGKSTLLNTILGEKISIVSARPQTTRNVIRGVLSAKDYQVVFLDTPGIHQGKGLLNRFMVKEAFSAMADVDAVLYMVEVGKPLTDDDRMIMEGLKNLKCPVILAINKVDAIEKPEILPMIDECSKLFKFKDIVPISALKGVGVEDLVKLLVTLLNEGPKYFPEDSVTDQPERFIVAEMIREKVFRFTHEEVPYATAVSIDTFTEKKGKGVVVIEATINVERATQKGIIIGKGGGMLKKIGSSARTDIERLLHAKVHLTLFVRVQEDWTRKPGALKEFGY